MHPLLADPKVVDKKFQLIEGQREGPKSKQLEVKVLMPDNSKKWVSLSQLEFVITQLFTPPILGEC